MKCQDLFSLKNTKKSKLSSAAVVIGTISITILWAYSWGRQIDDSFLIFPRKED